MCDWMNMGLNCQRQNVANELWVNNEVWTNFRLGLLHRRRRTEYSVVLQTSWGVWLFCNIQGGPKKVSQIIFAITLCTASQFPQFLAHVHCRKFATRRYIVSPPNTVCVTALPCKTLITTSPICLYMFTTINNNKYKHICTLDVVYVKSDGTQITAHYWNVIHGHKGFVAA